MKIGALIRSYSITRFLPAVIASYGWCDQIAVMNYRFKTAPPRADDTRDLCAAMRQHVGAQLLCDSGDGLEQHEILNRGLGLLAACELVWIADADEILRGADQRRILAAMTENRHSDHAAVRIADYAENFDHAFPPRLGFTVVMVDPARVRFTCIRRHTGERCARFHDITLHNLGYVWSADEMDWKYQWLNAEERTDARAICGEIKRRRCPLPLELRELIKASEVWA